MQKGTERACEACGESFPVHPRERNPRRFCDATCAHWAKRNPGLVRGAQQQCENCVAMFAVRVGKRFCSTLCGELANGQRAYGPKGGVVKCVVCGERKAVEFGPGVPGGVNTKCCSPECRARWVAGKSADWYQRNTERARERDRQRDRSAYLAVKRARRALPRARAAAAAVSAVPRPALPPVTSQWCLACGKQCERPDLQPGTVVCFGCAEAWRRNLFLRLRIGPFVAGHCQTCGDSFVTTGTRGDRFCSRRCGKADGRQRRRARKRSAFVEPVIRRKVFERDGWRCHLCGKKVRRNAKVPHPMAPTIDHIIPSALGGEESMRNVRTAHFICNSRKRDTAMNEQLLLVG